MELALSEARARGLLGASLLDSGFAFDLEVTRGAGSYVCGEETGLIASVEGLRRDAQDPPALPRSARRLRYALQRQQHRNLRQRAADHRARRGLVPRVRHRIGPRHQDVQHLRLAAAAPASSKSPSGCLWIGCCSRPAAAPEPGRQPKGIQPGGPLGGLLPASDLGLALERPPFTERGVLLGSGGLILFDERASAVDLTLYFSEFCEDESCGRCTTCHGGSQRLVELLQRIMQGGGRREDLERIGALDRTLQNSQLPARPVHPLRRARAGELLPR